MVPVWKRTYTAAIYVLGLCCLLVFFSEGSTMAQASSLEDADDTQLLKQTIKKKPALKRLFTRFGEPETLLARFAKGKQRAAQEWQTRQSQIPKMTNLGTTQTLEILPLIEWDTSDEALKGEAGVSYLIKTDHSTILFDVGYNRDQKHPSPLLKNMKQLGVRIADFDTIVISHNHLDHVGGRQWSSQQTFSLTNHQMDLEQKKAYTPVPMSYPGLKPVISEQPTTISPGVATTGIISTPLFFLGWVSEQALAIHVAGKGIVLIVGCGHQSVPKLLSRVDAMFDAPLYGIIGGLHYPVTESRLKMGNLELQKYIGTGKIPGRPITIADVQRNISLLKKRNLGIVGLSPHDSCDASIAEFRKAFTKTYRSIKVGDKIVIGSPE